MSTSHSNNLYYIDKSNNQWRTNENMSKLIGPLNLEGLVRCVILNVNLQTRDEYK